MQQDRALRTSISLAVAGYLFSAVHTETQLQLDDFALAIFFSVGQGKACCILTDRGKVTLVYERPVIFESTRNRNV